MSKFDKFCWVLLLLIALAALCVMCGCQATRRGTAPPPPLPPGAAKMMRMSLSESSPQAAVPLPGFRITSFSVGTESVTLTWAEAPTGDVTIEGAADTFGPWISLGSFTDGSASVPRLGPRSFYRLKAAGAQGLWVDTPATAVDDYARAVAQDPAGNIVVTGDMSNTLFIRKYSSGGALLWSKQFSGTAYGRGIACDAAGNVYVTGSFAGAIDLGAGWLAGGSGIAGDCFIVAYGPGGDHRWSKVISSGQGCSGNAIAVTGESVYVGGGLVGAVVTECGSLATGVFLVKLGVDGSCQWASPFGGQPQSAVLGVAANSESVWLTGVFLGAVSFGGDPLAGNGFDAFLAKLDSQGSHILSRRYGDNWVDKGHAITLVPGGVVWGGEFRGAVNFGGGPLTTGGFTPIDGFLVRLDYSGVHVWSKQVAGAAGAQDRVRAVSARGDTILAGGDAIGSVDFGCGPRIGGGGPDAFIARFDAAGVCLDHRSFGGYSIDQTLGLCPGAAVGAWFGSVDFGTGNKISQGGGDAFILSLP